MALCKKLCLQFHACCLVPSEPQDFSVEKFFVRPGLKEKTAASDLEIEVSFVKLDGAPARFHGYRLASTAEEIFNELFQV